MSATSHTVEHRGRDTAAGTVGHTGTEDAPLLTVIVPVYNEAATVAELLRRVLAGPYPAKQVVVVDDGSTDGTAEVLAGWHGRSGITVVTHSGNRGKGRAIRTGLDYACGVYTIIQDADLEYDPRDYERMIEPLRYGHADVVFGSRYLSTPARGGAWAFRLGVAVLNHTVWCLYETTVTDEATCYKAMPTALLRSMDLECEKFEFCPEVTAKACRLGLAIHEVPISYRARDVTEGKKIRWTDGVEALRELWKWRRWEGPAAGRRGVASDFSRQSSPPFPPRLRPPVIAAARRGFTLAELLTVIGIIAALLGLILPAVSRVREAADVTRCLVQLRTIGHAANLHALEHAGYLPAAGWHWAPTGGRCDPVGLNDPEARRYTYYTDAGVRRPVPVTAALASALGVELALDSRAGLENDLRRPDLTRHFQCPAQPETLTGVSQREDGPGWIAPPEASGYVFNEAVLGRRDLTPDRPQYVLGKLSRVRHPDSVMFAMDGRPRNQTGDNWILVFEKGPHDSLHDFQVLTAAPNGFGKETFDLRRHRGKLNVLFLDGHATTIQISPGDLKAVGVSEGVYY